MFTVELAESHGDLSIVCSLLKQFKPACLAVLTENIKPEEILMAETYCITITRLSSKLASYLWYQILHHTN